MPYVTCRCQIAVDQHVRLKSKPFFYVKKNYTLTVIVYHFKWLKSLLSYANFDPAQTLFSLLSVENIIYIESIWNQKTLCNLFYYYLLLYSVGSIYLVHKKGMSTYNWHFLWASGTDGTLCDYSWNPVIDQIIRFFYLLENDTNKLSQGWLG